MDSLLSEIYRSKICTAQDAARRIRPGNRVFVGTDARAAVKQGRAEYLPISIARVPELFNVGRISLDVALIQVSERTAWAI